MDGKKSGSDVVEHVFVKETLTLQCISRYTFQSDLVREFPVSVVYRATDRCCVGCVEAYCGSRLSTVSADSASEFEWKMPNPFQSSLELMFNPSSQDSASPESP